MWITSGPRCLLELRSRRGKLQNLYEQRRRFGNFTSIGNHRLGPSVYDGNVLRSQEETEGESKEDQEGKMSRHYREFALDDDDLIGEGVLSEEEM